MSLVMFRLFVEYVFIVKYMMEDINMMNHNIYIYLLNCSLVFTSSNYMMDKGIYVS